MALNFYVYVTISFAECDLKNGTWNTMTTDWEANLSTGMLFFFAQAVHFYTNKQLPSQG